MGGKDGPVTGGRILVTHQVEDFLHHAGIGGRRPGRPDFHGIRTDGIPLPVQPVQDRRSLDAVFLVGDRRMAEHQQDVVIAERSGKVPLAEGFDIGLDIFGERIESRLVKEHHFPGFGRFHTAGQGRTGRGLPIRRVPVEHLVFPAGEDGGENDAQQAKPELCNHKKRRYSSYENTKLMYFS